MEVIKQIFSPPDSCFNDKREDFNDDSNLLHRKAKCCESKNYYKKVVGFNNSFIFVFVKIYECPGDGGVCKSGKQFIN